ncbi:MAG: capsule biosynthesis protein CapK [Acidobacteriota bacterium]
MDEPGDSERFPNISENGRRILRKLREHPHAPRFTASSGNRLTAEGLRRVRAFEAELNVSPIGWEPGRTPPWLEPFVEMCFRDVPFYRRYGARPAQFADVPTPDRGDLASEPWSFVPDTLALDGLIAYGTSGTTGHPVQVPSHPVVASCYLPLLERALAWRGVAVDCTGKTVACMVIGYQRSCFTYVSVTPYFADAGYVKINLHPDDWRAPDDRRRFIEACDPELVSGDPISLAEMVRLPLTIHPKAVISTSMTLLPGLARSIEERFGCPVIDLYSLNEAGPVAVRLDAGHAVIQHRLYVEILDADGNRCPPGVRGEITLTGGFNPFLPLLRYRTGDQAELGFDGAIPVLIGLEGRLPTVFRTASGALINNIDVTHALKRFALAQFTLHQHAGGSLRLRVAGLGIDEDQIRIAMLDLFGPDHPLAIEPLSATGEKVLQYTTDPAPVA